MAYRLAKDAPIGIFDSGAGGLAVLKEVSNHLPDEDVLYIGDTARRPYGTQAPETVRRYAVELTGYLARLGAKLVIIGCNTASVAGWEAAQMAYPEIPVLGMLGPGVRAALAATRSKRIGVWGTELTAESRAYDRLIEQAEPSAQVTSLATPELMRLTKRGQIDDRAYLRQLSAQYLEPLRDIDTLILGCTDLTCVRDIIGATAGAGVTVVDPAEAVTLEAKRILTDAEALHPAVSISPDETVAPTNRIMITRNSNEEFATFAARFLNLPGVDVEQVDVRDVQQPKESS